MAAFIWNANPKMWMVVPPASDGWDALKAYVVNPSGYVYWSTPLLRADIKAGDKAFIWRTTYKKEKTGFVAVGQVQEKPRQLTPSSASLFSFPASLKAAGWNESTAPSVWKTGIKIEKTFWDDPVNTGLSPNQGTVGRLSEDDIKAIERAVASR